MKVKMKIHKHKWIINRGLQIRTCEVCGKKELFNGFDFSKIRDLKTDEENEIDGEESLFSHLSNQEFTEEMVKIKNKVIELNKTHLNES